ncbi:hypothetical protein ONZ45_g17363 [Pleurotus djamor]|nr:hypothetical protein ONZ45_g17363 [Pleurotus djamor]
MSTSSILRASRRASLKPVGSPKSILKRSATLALSPLLLTLPYSSCPTLNSPTSPLPQSPSSPHVHFPPTPSMSSTFVTHSSMTYDRVPIDVAPNPLELPPRGERSYNVSFADSLSHGIVPIDVPPVDIEIDFAEDPRSPSAAGLTSPPPAFHRFVRFATLSPHSPLPNSLSPSSARDYATVASGTASYPRSPYPVASSPPLTPAEDEDSAPMEQKMKPRRVVAWKGHGELRLSDLFAAPSISSPLRQSHFSNAKTSKVTTPSPQASSPSIASVSSKPPPLDLNSGSDVDSECSNPSSQLRKAFWRSVSLVDLHDEDAAASAWSYPPSAVELQEFLAEQADLVVGTSLLPLASLHGLIHPCEVHLPNMTQHSHRRA